MKTRILLIALPVLLLTSCSQLMQIAQTIDTNQPLSQSDIIAGLKEALIVGADSSSTKLGLLNGYYGDELVKIVLPSEASPIVENLSKIPGGDKLVDDVILRINRAAENAASEAKPIFVNSIKNMSIADAVGILNGEDNAATQYLKNTTYDELVKLYSPKIKSSLDKEIVGGISTNDSWDKLTGEWNKVAGSIVGQVAGLKSVETNLEDYLTAKALDGLFLKIAEEEKQIRTDPLARVTELLKKVFN